MLFLALSQQSRDTEVERLAKELELSKTKLLNRLAIACSINNVTCSVCLQIPKIIAASTIRYTVGVKSMSPV